MYITKSNILGSYIESLENKNSLSFTNRKEKTYQIPAKKSRSKSFQEKNKEIRKKYVLSSLYKEENNENAGEKINNDLANIFDNDDQNSFIDKNSFKTFLSK